MRKVLLAVTMMITGILIGGVWFAPVLVEAHMGTGGMMGPGRMGQGMMAECEEMMHGMMEECEEMMGGYDGHDHDEHGG